MNLKHCEAFYWIHRLGSFHGAARQLGISQGAISARVKELEESLGTALFDRSRGGVRITPKGHELLPYAAQFVALASEVRQRIGTKEALTGRVRFGATNIHALTWLPGLIGRTARTYPGIALEVMVDTSETLRASLERGGLDLAVIAGTPEDGRLPTLPVGTVPHVWVASPGLELPVQALGAAELARWPLVCDRPGTILHGAMLDWFREEAAEPQRCHSASHLQTRIHLARIGLGVAIVARSAVERELAAGTLIQVATRRSGPLLSYALATASGAPSHAVVAVRDLAANLIARKPDLNAYYVAASEGPVESSESLIID